MIKAGIFLSKGGLMKKYNELHKTVWIDRNNHKDLRLLSIKTGKGISYLVNAAVRKFIIDTDKD